MPRPPAARLVFAAIGYRIARRPRRFIKIVAAPEIDTVVAAIVGAAGLQSTWAALEAGKKVALANKETLVMAGPLVMALAARTGAEILPIDSEHSAVFQCLQSGHRGEVRRIILTASGGPFRNFTPEQLARVSVEQALEHPTWDMGPKITIDSGYHDEQSARGGRGALALRSCAPNKSRWSFIRNRSCIRWSNLSMVQSWHSSARPI